ncbi:hypothetical protein D3C72_663560 [compost metagenome]
MIGRLEINALDLEGSDVDIAVAHLIQIAVRLAGQHVAELVVQRRQIHAVVDRLLSADAGNAAIQLDAVVVGREGKARQEARSHHRPDGQGVGFLDAQVRVACAEDQGRHTARVRIPGLRIKAQSQTVGLAIFGAAVQQVGVARIAQACGAAAAGVEHLAQRRGAHRRRLGQAEADVGDRRPGAGQLPGLDIARALIVRHPIGAFDFQRVNEGPILDHGNQDLGEGLAH